MRLSDREMKFVNSPLLRFLQRRVEFPAFKRLGLDVRNKSILEIGCGSGYGAWLISKRRPKSYTGIDLMPEQIALAKKLLLENYEFMVMDSTDLIGRRFIKPLSCAAN